MNTQELRLVTPCCGDALAEWTNPVLLKRVYEEDSLILAKGRCPQCNRNLLYDGWFQVNAIMTRNGWHINHDAALHEYWRRSLPVGRIRAHSGLHIALYTNPFNLPVDELTDTIEVRIFPDSEQNNRLHVLLPDGRDFWVDQGWLVLVKDGQEFFFPEEWDLYRLRGGYIVCRRGPHANDLQLLPGCRFTTYKTREQAVREGDDWLKTQK